MVDIGLNSPALLTTSVPGTVRAAAGVLGQNTTTTLFGDDLITDASLGGRFKIGWNLEEFRHWDVNLEYLFLGKNSENLTFTSTGAPILARPSSTFKQIEKLQI